ncbi:hypothetical protein J6590_085291 [Homalodisca vitripennis]|nr:hypothetical protein J6590_073875 [Homalodisca vitripennis]KAG8324731.1 hypothetical protein J6590_085291 [Homalodisca vitripennis]
MWSSARFFAAHLAPRVVSPRTVDLGSKTQTVASQPKMGSRSALKADLLPVGFPEFDEKIDGMGLPEDRDYGAPLVWLHHLVDFP